MAQTLSPCGPNPAPLRPKPSPPQVALGMSHLHALNIIHGDLKPGNVLLKSSRLDSRGFVAKVADFGLSRLCASGSSCVSTSEWATVLYMVRGRAGRLYMVRGRAGIGSRATWPLGSRRQAPHQPSNPSACVSSTAPDTSRLPLLPTAPPPPPLTRPPSTSTTSS